MEHTATTISKEQYERLAKLAGEKEPDFTIDRKQHGFGDLFSSFLQEEVNKSHTGSTANSDVSFCKLVESLLN